VEIVQEIRNRGKLIEISGTKQTERKFIDSEFCSHPALTSSKMLQSAKVYCLIANRSKTFSISDRSAASYAASFVRSTRCARGARIRSRPAWNSANFSTANYSDSVDFRAIDFRSAGGRQKCWLN